MSETLRMTQRELERLLETRREQYDRIATLEAENGALWRFVHSADEWTKWCVCCLDEYEPQFRPAMDRYEEARAALGDGR